MNFCWSIPSLFIIITGFALFISILVMNDKCKDAAKSLRELDRYII